jgi:peptidoglycan/xylan/chitin deacetylase (PgdA/CDA1 family)
MNRFAGLLVLLLASGGLALAASDQKLPRVLSYTGPHESDNHIVRREVAVTFDDLPAVNLWEPASVKRMTQKLLRSITTHKVPATGFVNESHLTRNGQVDPVLVASLKLWLETGLELGNHSYSHFDLNSTTLATYQADIIRGEAITRRLLQPKGRKLRYFRHPYLHTGPTQETRTAMEQFLTRRGYQVAPVTIDNQDWVFAAAYTAARQRGDDRTMKRIVQAYLPYMERMFQFFEQLSVDLLGYEVRQVLLLHASPLNADTFDQLVAMMKRRGYRFIRLEQALQDPAYRLPDHYTGPEGLSWLHRWALTRGLPRRAEPREPDWLQEQLRSMRRRSGSRRRHQSSGRAAPVVGRASITVQMAAEALKAIGVCRGQSRPPRPSPIRRSREAALR